MSKTPQDTHSNQAGPRSAFRRSSRGASDRTNENNRVDIGSLFSIAAEHEARLAGLTGKARVAEVLRMALEVTEEDASEDFLL